MNIIVPYFAITLRTHPETKLFLITKLIFLMKYNEKKKLRRLTLRCITGPEIVSYNLFLKNSTSSLNA